MLPSQDIWLLYPFISGSNQYSKPICAQSRVYTFLSLIQISCSACLGAASLPVPRQGWLQPSRGWRPHAVGGSSGSGQSTALCGRESRVLPQGEKLGENKGKNQNMGYIGMRAARQLAVAGGRDGAADCLPALQLRILIFFLKSHEG